MTVSYKLLIKFSALCKASRQQQIINVAHRMTFDPACKPTHLNTTIHNCDWPIVDISSFLWVNRPRQTAYITSLQVAGK